MPHTCIWLIVVKGLISSIRVPVTVFTVNIRPAFETLRSGEKRKRHAIRGIYVARWLRFQTNDV